MGVESKREAIVPYYVHQRLPVSARHLLALVRHCAKNLKLTQIVFWDQVLTLGTTKVEVLGCSPPIHIFKTMSKELIDAYLSEVV